MDLTESEEYRRFRSEVRAFVAEREERGDAFWEEALARGYLHRHIPRAFGGSEQASDPLKDRILAQEMTVAAVGRPPCGARESMLVHTLIDHGTTEQQRRFIGPTLAGELLWCQGYSEPNAGSDLASLRSTARVDGDHFVVDGQKIWTSGAAESHYMFGLFRSEPEASKHAGISYLLIDMKSPGVRVAPMKTIDGGFEFNEVFFDDVRVPLGNLVGERGEGWRVSRSTLKYERGLIAGAGFLREQLRDVVALARDARVDGQPVIDQPAVRQRLADIAARIECQDSAAMRMLTSEISGNIAATLPLMLMAKLYATDVLESIARVAEDVCGDAFLREPSAADQVFEGDPATASYWLHKSFWALGTAHGGGTSKIQRNIIGEQVLGLPRDRRPPTS